MRVSRRTALACLPFATASLSAEKGKVLPAEGVRYADPATEFPVERLTDPKFASFWPYPYAKSIAKKGLFFLFSSDRGDGLQAYRYELRSGEIRQLTGAKALRQESLNLIGDDRLLAYIDGRSLFVIPLSGGKEREVYQIPEGWEMGDGFCVSGDGIYATLIEKQGSKCRLRLIAMARGNAVTLAEADQELRHPQPRPRRASVLYQRGETLHLVNYDGQNDQKIANVAPSEGAALWSPDGRTVLYLEAKDRTVVMKEVTPDNRQDKVVANTSQYQNFSRNVDGSVFVAASRSVAQPYILLMVRSVRRELTICEHKSSNPGAVAPVFSPTSQRIYFTSDRHGKSAIYSVVVDKYIEKTES